MPEQEDPAPTARCKILQYPGENSAGDLHCVSESHDESVYLRLTCTAGPLLHTFCI